jgi:hypothetical protein
VTFINLDLINKLAETINYIVGTLGIIAGGIWVYWKFIFQRVGKWNLGLEIFPEIIPYDDQTALLKIVVKLKNKGSVKISPCNKGCRLTVRSICNIGNDNLLNLDSGSPIINDYDMLKKYYKENSGYKAYEIEPLCEYSKWKLY